KEAQISKLAADLASFGRRDGNIFELKDKEFAGAVAGAKVVGENRALADELEKEVSALRTRSEMSAATAARTSEGEIDRGRIILSGLALASLATAGALGWLYVGRNVSRRLSGLRHSMTSIAAGDLDAEIATNGSDEIADMASALSVLREARRTAVRSDAQAA